jgi:predicted dehydrogenase
MVRVLIVGLGSSGRRHLKLANEYLPNAEIRVFRPKRSNQVAKIDLEILTSEEAVVAFAPTIAILANPSPFHIDIANLLAKIGTHMLIEKPLSDSSSGVIEFLSLCEKNNIVVCVGYNLRFLPSLMVFQQYLSQDIVGQVLSVHSVAGQYLPSWRPTIDYRESVSAQKILGGGVLLELSHELDYLQWIFGEIEWVSATLSKQSNLEIDVEDMARITMGINPKDSGHQVICSLDIDFFRKDHTRQCLAIGEKGTLRWDGISGKVDINNSTSNGWKTLFTDVTKIDLTYKAEWEYFLQCVSEDQPPKVGAIDGLRVLEVIEAARQSSSASKKVFVNYSTKIQEEKI